MKVLSFWLFRSETLPFLHHRHSQ